MGIQINGSTDRITAIDGTIDFVSNIGNIGLITASRYELLDSITIGAGSTIIKTVNGNIGIGTDGPTDTLHISKVANHGITLDRPAGGSNPGSASIKVHSHGALVATSANNITYTSGGSNNHIFNRGSDESLRIDSTGRTLIGAGAIATPKITGPGGLDVSQYGLSICMGGSSGSSGQARANATTKEARLVIPHYTNAEEPLTAIAGFSASSFNYLNYGGGTSLGNVATRHQFYTAADTTTTGGSEKLKIEHTGVRSFATFVDTSYHANPDPFADGSGLAYYRLNYNFHDSGLYAKHATDGQGSPNNEFNGSPHFSLVNSSGEPCWDNPHEGAVNIPVLKNSYPFTVAAWVNMSSWPTTSNNDLIMNLNIAGQRVSICNVVWVNDTYSEWSIMYGGTNHWTFSPSSRPTNQWIHIVYSVVGNNNSSHAVYQNGTALSATNRGGGHGGTAGWAIGGNAQNSERFAMGRIGSIRFFNKALSSSEASALYTNDKFYT